MHALHKCKQVYIWAFISMNAVQLNGSVYHCTTIPVNTQSFCQTGHKTTVHNDYYCYCEFCSLVDLLHDDVAPVDEGHNLSFLYAGSICTLYVHFGAVPDLLHAHTIILKKKPTTLMHSKVRPHTSVHLRRQSRANNDILTSLTRCATFVALPVCHDAPLEWLSHVPLRALQMQMRELYGQSEYLLWFCPCFFRSSRRRKLFLDRFLQGESVAESGSIISHYFRTYFSLYVVPRGLNQSGPANAQVNTLTDCAELSLSLSLL